jgi:hypothetical protein
MFVASLGLLLAACSGEPPASPSPSVSATPPPAVATGNASVQLTAGPVCPVETVPPDPACAPQPVAGALVIAVDGGGNEMGRATSDADGHLLLVLPAGRFVIAPQPVEGLMGTPEGQTVLIRAAETSELTFSYDTGIR